MGFSRTLKRHLPQSTPFEAPIYKGFIVTQMTKKMQPK